MSERGSTRPAASAWAVVAHPLFVNQLQQLVHQVAALQAKDPKGYLKRNAAKRLAAILKLAFEDIPADPTRPEYRQGDTLGDDYKHWFRAKFFQQYRLFFRYHLKARVIVLAWVNDDATLRAYESKSDAYRVFKKMLDDGHPPDDWDTLLAETQAKPDLLDEALEGAGQLMPGSQVAGTQARGRG